jgi:hypothetical protein
VTEVVCSYKTNNGNTFCYESASGKSCTSPIRHGAGFLVAAVVMAAQRMAAMLMMVQYLTASGMAAIQLEARTGQYVMPVDLRMTQAAP